MYENMTEYMTIILVVHVSLFRSFCSRLSTAPFTRPIPSIPFRIGFLKYLYVTVLSYAWNSFRLHWCNIRIARNRCHTDLFTVYLQIFNIWILDMMEMHFTFGLPYIISISKLMLYAVPSLHIQYLSFYASYSEWMSAYEQNVSWIMKMYLMFFDSGFAYFSFSSINKLKKWSIDYHCRSIIITYILHVLSVLCVDKSSISRVFVSCSIRNLNGFVICLNSPDAATSWIDNNNPNERIK